MELLKELSAYSQSGRTAMVSGNKKITYSQLWEQSDRLAKYIKQECRDDKTPVVVYGHKDPMMLVAFLSCAKSGRAYVPLDINMPWNRIEAVINAVQPRLVLITEPMGQMEQTGQIGQAEQTGQGKLAGQAEQTGQGKLAGQTGQTEQTGQTGQAEQTEQTGQTGQAEQTGQTKLAGQTGWHDKCYYINIVQDARVFQAEMDLGIQDYIKEDEVYYIIFTSGSTGEPKGVQITYGALNRFVEWALTLGNCEKRQRRFLNQAPFSFDLSVMDVYMSLATESCLFSLEKHVQADYKHLFCQLKESNANVWISTPSFADLCLADPMFSQGLMPEMELFLFCGETLANKTAASLLERFPKAQVYNTYGPTESTVAVTQVCVDRAVVKEYDPLPVGAAKPGTMIRIVGGGYGAAA